jgi:formyltetrahydrofolate deformylase
MKNPVLLIACDDRAGLVHAVTGVMLKAGVNIVSNHEFVEEESRRFFMRTEFEGLVDFEKLHQDVRAVLPQGAEVSARPPALPRLVILVSKEHHCLADLLVRHAFGELHGRILAVAGNHEVLRPLAEKFDIPFLFADSEGVSRETHEAKLVELIAPLKPDYLVLAKYMRILSAAFVSRWPERIINIHHSFLPAFAGAKPYHQAFQRGVKVIGATAHFVTPDLDAGPILVQQVIPVDHTHTPQELARSGRDVEQMALSKAMRLVLESRVFICNNRTIIFD